MSLSDLYQGPIGTLYNSLCTSQAAIENCMYSEVITGVCMLVCCFISANGVENACVVVTDALLGQANPIPSSY